MNSPLNNTVSAVLNPEIFIRNTELFALRFPELAALLGFQARQHGQKRDIPPHGYLLQPAKTRPGEEPQLTLAIDRLFLHSKYNPQEEARRIFATEFFSEQTVQHRCLFAGLGLGYLPALYMQHYPDSEVIIVEPDVNIFTCFLAAQLHSGFFQHKKLTLLIGTAPEEAVSCITSQGSVPPVFKNNNAVSASKAWYDVFFTLLERNRTKDSINAKTLERFSKLWLRNTVKNGSVMHAAAGVGKLKNAFRGSVAVVLAGGPSLTKHLQLLQKHPRNYVLIAVDTAIRAALAAHITPDFAVSTDPQYWNYLHTAGLDTSGMVLITEAAVFPASLRQRYRALFLAQSSVPLARYFSGCAATDDEKLAAGGSVSTTAWDFARFIGAGTIIMAGLDLGFPHKQTHFKGSRFEENTHIDSGRLNPAEQERTLPLFTAFPEFRRGYGQEPVLTDRRMLIYAWWFESTLVKYPDIHTYNLEPEGIAIPGMPMISAESAFSADTTHTPYQHIQKKLAARIAEADRSDNNSAHQRKKQMDTAVRTVLYEMQNLQKVAGEALSIAGLLSSCTDSQRKSCLEKLTVLDEHIRNSIVKDIISLLYFTEQNGYRTGTVSGSVAQGNGTDTDAAAVYKRIYDLAEDACTLINRYGGIDPAVS